MNQASWKVTTVAANGGTTASPTAAHAVGAPQPWTLPDRPGLGLRALVAALVVPRLLARLPVRVRVGSADGDALDLDADTLLLRRPWACYRRVGKRGLIGFGESYQAGEWDHADLAGFLTLIAERIDAGISPAMRNVRRLVGPRRRRREENSIAGARENIRRHYDLSNEMFSLLLDETMTYSCALFDIDKAGRPIASAELLATAQLRKVDRLLDATGVGPGSHILEIGTGWGTLAIQAAKRGARVHTITNSAEQRALAARRIAAAGVAGLVDLELCDYREVSLPAGRTRGYDAILSVEMIEAVGERYLPDYFATIDRLLALGGRVGLQAITMRHDRMLVARRTRSWMNEYIFPGGFMPSAQAIEATVNRHTGLRVADRFKFGGHYAATLRVWRECFAARAAEVEKLGFTEVFGRTWILYLALCEAGFRSGYLDVGQFVLDRGAHGS